ncbi:MAG: hypothetical protein ACLQEG_08545 [Acidimicrobiales bacterium]
MSPAWASLPTHGDEQLFVRARDRTLIVDDRRIPLTSSTNC